MIFSHTELIFRVVILFLLDKIINPLELLGFKIYRSFSPKYCTTTLLSQLSTYIKSEIREDNLP